MSEQATTLTVHNALAKLKIYNKRLSEMVDELEFCKALPVSITKINGQDPEMWKKTRREQLDSFKKIIENRNAIQKAILLSNAQTHTTVCGKEYSIAELIWMKQVEIPDKKALLLKMKSNFGYESAKIKNNEDEVILEKANEYAHKQLASPLGNTQKVDKNSEAYELLVQSYIKQNSYVMHDAVGVEKNIAELQSYIDEFESEVDSAISVSNAITTITVNI